MHIKERYYFVDDNGKEVELACTVDRSIKLLGRGPNAVDEEARRIRDNELIEELAARGLVRKKPWWKFW